MQHHAHGRRWRERLGCAASPRPGANCKQDFAARRRQGRRGGLPGCAARARRLGRDVLGEGKVVGGTVTAPRPASARAACGRRADGWTSLPWPGPLPRPGRPAALCLRLGSKDQQLVKAAAKRRGAPGLAGPAHRSITPACAHAAGRGATCAGRGRGTATERLLVAAWMAPPRSPTPHAAVAPLPARPGGPRRGRCSRSPGRWCSPTSASSR